MPALLVELDTTGVSREDRPIHVVCRLVDQSEDGELIIVASYTGFQVAERPSTPESFAVHGLTEDLLRGKELDLPRLREMVADAACIISRYPRFTAKKLHAFIPECLDKRWYEYPSRIQGYPGASFPANERIEVLIGNAESFGYGRCHPLTELLDINAEQYELVFDEDGPPEVSVRFGRRKVLGGFAEALLRCAVGTPFRLHGKEDYDFITGYCNDGPAFRERAFRLATTPSNLQLVHDHHRGVYLERIEGLSYFLALK
ncbi:MAG: hypothetical protein ACOH1P_08165 [Lysobacter sp.]